MSMSFDTDIELDPTELDYVNRRLSIIGNFDKIELPAIMRDVALDLETEVELYPPAIAGSKYVRTGTYAASVFSETKAITNGMQTIAGSRGAIQKGRRYDQYLKDGRNQAAIHKGRWTTMADDADEVMPILERKLQVAMGKMKI